MELNQPKKIIIVSSGQPSLNPRLVKEADALAATGYDVSVFYAYWNDWGTQFDRELIPAKKWKAICVGGDPQVNKTAYFVSRAIHKLARQVSKITRGNFMAEQAIARAAYPLMQEVRKHEADLYIAHNLGALPATVLAAKSNQKPCGFDAEDFHRNEVSDESAHPDVILKTRLEEKYIPQVDYLTASSPQIAEAYKKLFPGFDPVVLLNVFPKETELRERIINQNGPIRLLWFSQTIGTNRGLKDILNALELLKDQPFELYLLGNCSEDVKAELTGNIAAKIYFHKPIHPDELAKFASRFDLGLALEPGFSINNNLALSNKIFTYLQAGLCVLASDTVAQRSFMDAWPAIGSVYPRGDAEFLSQVLLNYQQDRTQLFAAQQAAYLLARQQLNWETEQEKFLAVVKNTLSRH